MVAKVAGGIIGLGLIGTGSVAMAKPEWFGINKEITWKPLSQDKDFTGEQTKSNYNSKFGSAYKYYLVGATSNEDWWKESFERLKKEKPTSKKFKYEERGSNNNAVKSGFDSSSTNALNQICKAAYKSASTNIKETPTSDSNDDYKEADVWKYCSPLGEKPKTVEEVDANKYKGQVSDQDPIGKDDGNRKKLISTTGNDKFWEIREKEFRGKPGYEKIEGSDAEADLFFHPANKTESIRQLCEKAYQQPETSENKSTADKPKKDKTLKYCSLDKQ